jgi:hypothetical protein
MTRSRTAGPAAEDVAGPGIFDAPDQAAGERDG